MAYRKDQQRVQTGIVFGVTASITFIAAVYYFLPVALPGQDGAGARLAYALRWDLLLALTLAVAIPIVGVNRFRGENIMGERHVADPVLEINLRFLQNTLEQVVLAYAAHLTLAILLPAAYLRLIPALAIWFVIARVAFWIGYHRHPLSRSFGFADTILPTQASLLVCGLLAVF